MTSVCPEYENYIKMVKTTKNLYAIFGCTQLKYSIKYMYL